MDIYHYRSVWGVPPHKLPQLEAIVKAIVDNDWAAIFNQPSPNLPALQVEVFSEWLSRQDLPNVSPSSVRPRWRMYLRRSSLSWERFKTTCLKKRQHTAVMVSAVDTNLQQLWPDERNLLRLPKLRVTKALLANKL